MKQCPVCHGTGFLYATPDGLDHEFNKISVNYNQLTCWRCVGIKAVQDDTGADLSKSNPNTDLKGNSFADIRAAFLSPEADPTDPDNVGGMQ